MSKISIRFFNDREVRAVWDEDNSKWWFNVVDIVSILNEQPDYIKSHNYWRWLKRKLKLENNELVSATHSFKFVAPDGKKRLADTLDSDGVIELAKNFPNTKAVKFLDWFLYSDNTIDGQSKKKTHPFMEGNGRSTRIWLDLMLKRSLKKCVDWSLINKNDYLNAMSISPADGTTIKRLVKNALTDKINDREIFMKGIDYSYYYEEP